MGAELEPLDRGRKVRADMGLREDIREVDRMDGNGVFTDLSDRQQEAIESVIKAAEKWADFLDRVEGIVQEAIKLAALKTEKEILSGTWSASGTLPEGRV